MENTTKTQKIYFLLIPEFSMLALTATIDPLRVANRFQKGLYEWILVAETLGPVHASNGIPLYATATLDEVTEPHIVFICSSFNPKRYISPTIRGWLRELDTRGVTLGTMDTGLYFLADSGLIGKEKTTLHWEGIPAFKEDYPNVVVTSELYEVSPRRLYCSGGTAGLDMMLHKIMQEHDPSLAVIISEALLQERIRPPSEQQRLNTAKRHNIHNKRLSIAVALMEENIEHPINIESIAKNTHISIRQLTRLFSVYLNDSPNSFYLKIRLNRARTLLRETDLSITEIGVATGFQFLSYFSRAYRNHFNKTPKQERLERSKLSNIEPTENTTRFIQKNIKTKKGTPLEQTNTIKKL